MTDRDRYQLRGPVHTVQFTFSSIDPETNDWAPVRQGPAITFDYRGHDARRVRTDNTVFSTTFDERGLRMTISARGPSIRRQPGLEYGLCMSEGQLRDVLTRYDERDRPIEIVHRDREDKTIFRTFLSYDDHDRVQREEVMHGESLGGSWGTAASESQPEQPLTDDQIHELKASIIAQLKDRVFSTLEYTYDDRGRVAQLRECMPPVSEYTRTFAYDAYGNIVEEHYESASRDAGFDIFGNEVMSNERSDETWNRCEYRYDDRGNWVEKVTLHRLAPDRNFHRSSIERRTITYFDSPLQTSNSASDQG